MTEKIKITRSDLWNRIYLSESGSRHERAPDPTVEFIDRKVAEAINSGRYEIIPEKREYPQTPTHKSEPAQPEESLKKADKAAKYKLQMEALYKEQYGAELKFDTVEKRGKFLVASVKKKEMHEADKRHAAHETTQATYFVVPFKRGKLGNEGLWVQIDSAPAHEGYGCDRDGPYDIRLPNTTSLKILAGKTVLADISSSEIREIDARDNAQVSAWIKQEYPHTWRSYNVHNTVSRNKDLDDNAKRIAKNDALKFAQGFIKKFICNGDEWTAEKSRLKRVEKIGILRKKVNDKWEKQAADEKKSAQEQKHRQAMREVSGQQRIMQRYVQKSLMERITDWFK